ncbi:MAG: VTT domain-containing protein, partial [Alphaproteobacteria bacterium]|nr:VTT domain-containing protein [Alphaproteobacteria bacterium]
MHGIIDHLVSVAAQLGSWGYLIIFVVVLLECQALLGLFIPGESMVLITGFLAGRGVFNLQALMIAIAAGAIVGDSIGYELGRHLGRTWLLRHGARVGAGPERLHRVESFMQRHGGKAVFAGHFMHVLRALMPFTAGMNRMAYWRFLAFNAAGCVLWACIFSFAGYWLGQSWRIFEKWIGRAGIAIGVVVVLALALAWLWAWLARNEHEVKARWQAFLARPGVVRFRARFARQIAFVERRLTPGGYVGLHLTVGALIFVGAAWWFGGVVEDLVTRDPIVGIDHRLAAWFNLHATPALTSAADVLTALGSYIVVGGTALVIVWLALRRSWHRVGAVAITVGGGAVLNWIVKEVFHRQRP